MVYLVNMSEKDFARKKNKFLPKIFEWVKEHGGEPIIPFSGEERTGRALSADQLQI